MNDKKRLNSYEDLPLVLDVADIQRIMGISRASAYELVHTPGFPAFRRGRLIKVMISSENPMSSIRSASSRTKKLTLLRSAEPREMWLIRRPGVAITDRKSVV